MTKLRTLTFLLMMSTAPFALTGCDSPEEKLANYIERGNELFNEENYTKARLEYKNAARLNPTSAEVRYRLGMLDEAEGDIRNAYANFVAAEQQDKDHHPTLLKLAQYFMASSQLAEAQNRLNKIFETKPNDADAIAIQAAVKLRQNDMDGAEKDAKHALSLDKANITAVAVLTGLYQKQGNTEKAGLALDDGIKNNPKDVSLLLLKVSLNKKAGNFSKIKETYADIFKLQPKNIGYRQSFASELMGKKLYDETEVFLRKTVSDFPDSWSAKEQLTKFLSIQKGLVAAEKEIHAYIKETPDEDRLYFWLADLYIAHKDTDRAATLLEQIVDKDANKESSLNARTTLARINIVKGDRSLAEKLVEAVLDKEPSHQDALYIRANLAHEDGAYQRATTDLRTIIRDNPKAGRAYQLLAEALLVQGRIDLAIDTLGRLLDINPAAGMAVRVRLAQMFEANNNAEQGLAILETVTKAQPNYPFGWESTARLALTANRLKLADQAITKVEKIKGYGSTAAFLKGQLFVKKDKSTKAALLFKKIAKTYRAQPIAKHAIEALSKIVSPVELATFLNSLESKTASTYNQLGNSYIAQRQLDSAAKSFDQAIEQKSMQAEPYISRARLYLNEKKLDEAYALLKQASIVDPSNYLAPITAADILTKQKKYKEAIALYEAIIVRNPDVHAAANNMADLISNHFATDARLMNKARLAAERFISSSNPLLLDTLAWVYYRQGKTQQALTIIQRAIAINDKLPATIHYHYGKILLETKSKDLAKVQLKKALDSKEEFDGKKDALKLLKGIK